MNYYQTMFHFPQLHETGTKESITGYCFLNWVDKPFYGYDVPDVRGFGPVKSKVQLEPLKFEYDEDGNPYNEYFEHGTETPSHIVPILNPIDEKSFVWYYGYNKECEKYFDGNGQNFVMLWYFQEPMSEFQEAQVFGPFNTEKDAQSWFATTGFFDHLYSDHEHIDECSTFIKLIPFSEIPLKKTLKE
jgi:hypothetical protein